MIQIKRAEIGLMEIVALILGIIVIIVSTTVIEGIAGTIFGKEQDTLKSYQGLVQHIQKLQSSQEQFVAEKSTAVFVDKDYIIVGYNKGPKTATVNDDICKLEGATKPDICGDRACLCLHKRNTGFFIDSNDDFDKANPSINPLQCDTFDKVDYIFTIYYNEDPVDGYIEVYSNEDYNLRNAVPMAVYKNLLGGDFMPPDQTDYTRKASAYSPLGDFRFANFFVYGRCSYKSSDMNFGAQSLYIERFINPEDKKTYLFIAYSDQTVLNHYNEMRKKYGQRTAKEYGDAIGSLLSQQQFEQAFNLFAEFRQRYPYYNLSKDRYLKLSEYLMTSLHNNDIEEPQLQNAVNLHEDFVKFYPNDPDAAKFLFNIGELYYEMEDYEKAKSAFKRVVSTKSPLAAEASDYVDELNVLIYVSNEGDYQQAIEKYQGIIQRYRFQESEYYDEIAEAHFKLGMIYLASRNPKFWIPEQPEQLLTDELEEVADRFPESPYATDAAYQLGTFYQQNEDYDLACFYYGQILSNYVTATSVFGEDLSTKAQKKFESLKQYCDPDQLDSVDTSATTGTPLSYANPKLANVDPDLIDILNRLQNRLQSDTAWQGVTFVIHEGCATTGHAENSYHYITPPSTYCNAVDYHLQFPEGINPPYFDQIARVEAAIQQERLVNDVGLGIYPTWNSKGFHLDNRGRDARWGFIYKKQVGYDEARDYARNLATA
jgi:TolA-binding protein